DPQHWRCYPKSPGAPQHVPQDGLSLGALPCLEVAAHRSIGVAVPFGQHRSTLLSVPLAWGETRSDRDCLAFGEQLEHQALPSSAAMIWPTEPRIRQFMPASDVIMTNFSHMSRRILSLARASNLAARNVLAIASTRALTRPERSPKLM